jgi:hypothetical protein
MAADKNTAPELRARKLGTVWLGTVMVAALATDSTASRERKRRPLVRSVPACLISSPRRYSLPPAAFP